VILAERVAAAAKLQPEGAPASESPDTEAASGESAGETPALPLQGEPKVLVVGGTGFIGRALVRRLREGGHAVRVLARDPRGVPPELTRLGVEIVRGDFTDPASVKAALGGIESVYHLARGFGKTHEEYDRFDVQPTRELAEVCLEHGVTRFIYASSIAIYYAGARAGTIDESTPPHRGMMRSNPYARSKVENERVLHELQEQRGLPLIIFRPGIVVGRGGSPYHFGVADWPYTSVARLWGSGEHPLPIVLVEDVADAMVRALDAPSAVGQSYNLCSPGCITAHEYLDELERRAGIRIKRIPTSGARYYAEAMGKWALKSVGGDRSAKLPSYGDWEGRGFAARFDCGKAERELGWRPEKDRAELIRRGIHLPVDESLR
jgi:nucleoside-diphosphate-sugar epimerase